MRTPVQADPDRSAVQEVLSGRTAAFETIVRRWQKPLVGLAFRYFRDRAVAEEMAQEAFLRVFRQLDRFEGSAAFSTWMFAVAINVYRSHLRRRGPPLVPLETAGDRADPGSGSEEVETLDTEEIVRRTVLRLPGRYREPLLLYYFGDRNLAETAGVLGLPEGTVKARLHRGRGLLRKRLASLLRPRPAAEEM